ncbi:MAG TPA: ClbS/DfsB family four-helix bundle protein [Longilinea sp.]|nr:ClbS/DfsB family four-helix bundle protein [Longilinea sp.]
MFTSKEFIHETESEWDELVKALKAIPQEKMIVPLKAGEWSVKDILAHLTWYEREMIGVVGQRALVGSDLWNRPLDERNRAVYDQLKDLPLAQVLADFTAVHEKLMGLLKGLSDAELNKPPLFKDMPMEWIPGDLIGSNTYEHYREHLKAIREWENNGT